MPHAEKDTMSTPMVNGEKPQSKVVSHITSYPVVSDSISFYKSHPVGQKSIDLANTAYDKLGKPVVPYLQGPYAYVKPYVEKADEIADSGLSTVDSKFPIIKEDTEKVKGTILDFAFFPLRVAGQGKEYVVGTFNDEYSKTQGQGIVKLVSATISTELKFGIDALTYAKSFFFKGVDKVQEKSAAATN